MKSSYKSWVLAAIMVAALASVFTPQAAAQIGSISGTITSMEGKPWAEVTIRAVSDQGAKQETKTDSAGRFGFLNMRAGIYTVFVVFPPPNDKQAPYEAGMVKVSSGEDAKVDVDFKAVLAKQGTAAQEQIKKNEEAKSKMEGLKAHFNAGNALIEQERQAKIDLQKATPDQRDAAKQKLADLGDQAVKEFQEASKNLGEKDPNAHLVWFKLGEAYETANRFDDAARAYQQAIAAKGDVPGYYNNLGNSLAKAGKIEEAKAAYTKSAELDPPNAATAWRNFGISLYNANRLADAIEPLQKATELDPKNAQSWYLLGASLLMKMTSKRVGDKEEVQLAPGTVEAYQKADELDPNGPWGQQARQGLADLKALGAGIDAKINVKKKKS
jgi:tetratricopeptide (TPR) repeat protein